MCHIFRFASAYFGGMAQFEAARLRNTRDMSFLLGATALCHLSFNVLLIFIMQYVLFFIVVSELLSFVSFYLVFLARSTHLKRWQTLSCWPDSSPPSTCCSSCLMSASRTAPIQQWPFMLPTTSLRPWSPCSSTSKFFSFHHQASNSKTSHRNEHLLLDAS